MPLIFTHPKERPPLVQELRAIWNKLDQREPVGRAASLIAGGSGGDPPAIPEGRLLTWQKFIEIDSYTLMTGTSDFLDITEDLVGISGPYTHLEMIVAVLRQTSSGRYTVPFGGLRWRLLRQSTNFTLWWNPNAISSHDEIYGPWYTPGEETYPGADPYVLGEGRFQRIPRLPGTNEDMDDADLAYLPINPQSNTDALRLELQIRFSGFNDGTCFGLQAWVMGRYVLHQTALGQQICGQP